MSRFVPWSKRLRLPASQSAPESSLNPLIHDSGIRRHTGLTSENPPQSQRFGLEVWAGPEDDDPEAIIIFVHGLGGSRRTWTSKTDGILWPKEVLSRNFPKILIMGFVYDSGYRDWLDAKYISRAAQDLNTDLLMWLKRRPRSTEQSDAPIIFVGHSLGGILCQKALVMAHASPIEGTRRIYISTIGLLLMSTPQMGSDLASWGHLMESLSKLFNRTTSNSFLRLNISSSIEDMAQIQVEFFRLVRDKHSSREISIICFFETRTTPGIGLIVSAQSAILPGYESIALDADHASMTKLEGVDDPGYQIFAFHLHNLIQKGLTETVGVGTHERQASELITVDSNRPMSVHSSGERIPSSKNSPEQILLDSVPELLTKGQFREAEAVQRQLLESTRLSYGAKDKRTLVLKKNLGTIYYLLGDWQESASLLRETVEESKDIFGKDDQRTFDAMSSLAVTLLCQGQVKEAMELQKDVVEGKSAHLGRNHFDTLKELAIFARILAESGRVREAALLRLEVLERREEVLGRDHPETLDAVGDTVLSDIMEGRLEEAYFKQRRLIRQRRVKFGREHPVILKELKILANILMQQGRFHEAHSIQEDVVNSMRAKIGYQHPDTLQAMQSLAFILSRIGRKDEAIELQERVCRILNKSLGRMHPSIGESRQLLEDLRKGLDGQESRWMRKYGRSHWDME